LNTVTIETQFKMDCKSYTTLPVDVCV